MTGPATEFGIDSYTFYSISVFKVLKYEVRSLSGKEHCLKSPDGRQHSNKNEYKTGSNSKSDLKKEKHLAVNVILRSGTCLITSHPVNTF